MSKLLGRSNLVFYLLVFLSIFVPLYPKFPLLNVSGTFVAIRIEDFFIALTFLVWFLLNFKKIPQILAKPIVQAIILFWAIGLLSLVSAILVTKSVTVHLGFLNWLRRVEDIGLFIIAATAITNSKQLKQFLIVGFITAILVILYGFGQYLGLPVISTTNSEYAKGQIMRLNPGSQPNSTFAGYYDLAVYLNIILVFLTSFLFNDKLTLKVWLSKIKEKLLLGVTMLMGGVLLGMTSERTSFLATLLGLITVFWVLGKKWLIVGLIILSSITVLAVPQLRHRLVATITVNILNGGGPKYNAPDNVTPLHNVGGLGTGTPNSTNAASFSAAILATKSATAAALPRDIAPGEPINITELGVSRSLNIRTDVEWPRALMAFEKNPILGTGYSSITIATDNDYLRSFGEVGIVGTLAFGLVFLIIIYQLISGFKSKQGLEKLFILGTVVSLFCVLLTGVVIDVLEASKVAEVLWILLGFAWAVSRNYDL